jgi:hypothetical protein
VAPSIDGVRRSERVRAQEDIHRSNGEAPVEEEQQAAFAHTPGLAGLKVKIDLHQLNLAASEYLQQHALPAAADTDNQEPLPQINTYIDAAAANNPKRRRTGQDRLLHGLHSVSAVRIEALRRCEDEYHPDPHAGNDRMKLRCQGFPLGSCLRTVHAECIGLSKGQALIGQYTCSHCLVNSMAATPATKRQREQLRQSCLKTALLRLVSKPERNTGGFKLLQNYVDQVEEEHGISSLLETEAGFETLFIWLCDQGFHQSIDSHRRNMAAFAKVKGFVNHCSSPSFKRTFKFLKETYGDEHTPDTLLPFTVFLIAIQLVKDRVHSGVTAPYVGARLIFQAYVEYFSGFRIGEVGGAGEGHGIMANDIVMNEVENVIEAVLGHSKTAVFAEEIVMPCVSASCNIAEAFKNLLAASQVSCTDTGGEVRPSYYVVRVSLEQITDHQLKAMDSLFSASNEPSVSDYKYRQWLKERVSRRRGAIDDKLRFVNVTGGSKTKCDRWTQLLRGAGAPADTTPGPLFRATRSVQGSAGRPLHKLTHMPVSVGEAADQIKELFTDAFKVYKARRAAGEIERDEDAEKISNPKWGSHSARRGGTRRAQLLMEKSKVSSEAIDMHFRWKSKKLKKKIQNMYGGVRPRKWRLQVTVHF